MDERETNEMMARANKPIRWVIPDSVRTEHATHLVVQQRGTEFTLLFFELQSPLFSGTPEQQLAEFQALEFTDATCVTKVVMSVENVVPGINNLIESLNKYNEILLASEKGQKDAERSELSKTS